MIEIKNYISGRVLYTSTSASDVRSALVEAVQKGTYLGGADLRGADLRGADLRGAYLLGAYLLGAYLRGADLEGADLRGADLEGADLRGADLRGADLEGADLEGADLRGADLEGADLRGAKGSDLAAAMTVVPAEGTIIGWKKAKNRIVKLEIPSDAKRLNATGRKCRASKARVLAIFDKAGNEVNNAYSNYDPSFEYTVGETVRPTGDFNEDRWEECSAGIHFFITREEAEAFAW